MPWQVESGFREMDEQGRLAGRGRVSESAADIMVRYRTTRSTWHYFVQLIAVVGVVTVVMVLQLVR